MLCAVCKVAKVVVSILALVCVWGATDTQQSHTVSARGRLSQVVIEPQGVAALSRKLPKDGEIDGTTTTGRTQLRDEGRRTRGVPQVAMFSFEKPLERIFQQKVKGTETVTNVNEGLEFSWKIKVFY